MKYKKKIDESLDNAYRSSSKYGFNIRLSENVIFFRKGLHWEYIRKDDISRIYRRVEPVSSYGSCCADSMDIQNLIIVTSDNETFSAHICDGEERLAEILYSRIQEAWPHIEYGVPPKDN